MYKDDKAYTLDEILERERLEEDCNKVSKVNKHMQHIKDNFVKRLEDLKMEYISNHIVETQEQYLTMTEIFEFLKKKA